MKISYEIAAGIEYPRTIQEFDSFFSTEEACREFITRLRWPQRYKCIKCGSNEKPWHTARGYLHCKECETEISITSGTIFEKTRFPLKTWFLAIWFVTSQKHGASALGLQRVLGLGSYQTAWTWLHKMRCAMVRPDRERLKGRIEVDETYIGGTKKGGKRGRGVENKDVVVIAVEIMNPKGFGRVRMASVANASGDSLIPFIRDSINPGSEILTDGWNGYNDLTRYGFKHTQTILTSSGDPAHISMPGVHIIAALLKRWLLGIHHGAVSSKHLDYYLDEYTFRFNRRTSKARGLLFYRLVEQAVITTSQPYRTLVDERIH